MKRRRKIITGVLAAVLAILMLVPIVMMILSSVSASAVTQSEIDALKAEAAELADKQQELKNKMSSIEYEQAAITAKKALIDEQIHTTQEEIRNINEQIALLEIQISEKEEEFRVAQEKEAAQFELFKDRVRAMEENGSISYFAVLFGSNDFSDLLSRLDFISEIMEYDELIVTNLEEAQAETERNRLALEASKADTESYRDMQYQMEAELQAQLEAANKLFVELSANKSEYQQAYEEYERQEQQMREDIDRKIEEFERSAAQSSVVSTGTYIWPSNDSRYVTSYFGPRTHPVFGTYRNHNGLDIGASYGTAVLAADSGTVVTSEYSSSYGNYIMISHGGSRYTLYAHMSERYSSVGDNVSQGDTIGLCGSTGVSTGPHIHFEVYEGGKRIDPLQFFTNYTVSPNA